MKPVPFYTNVVTLIINVSNKINWFLMRYTQTLSRGMFIIPIKRVDNVV